MADLMAVALRLAAAEARADRAEQCADTEAKRADKAEAERDALLADAERYRWLASRASKDTAYDRYGNGALWSIGFFADDSRHGLGAAIDAAMKGGGNG